MWYLIYTFFGMNLFNSFFFLFSFTENIILKCNEETNGAKNTGKVDGMWDESAKSQVPVKPATYDTAISDGKDSRTKENSGRGRGRRNRSSWGREQYRRGDGQRNEYRQQREDSNYKRREGERIDSRTVRQRKEYDVWGKYENSRKYRRNDRREKYHERRDEGKRGSLGKSEDVSQQTSEGSISNGDVEFIHSVKPHLAKSNFEQSAAKGFQRNSQLLKPAQDSKRCPSGIKARGPRCGFRGKSGDPASDFESWR